MKTRSILIISVLVLFPSSLFSQSIETIEQKKPRVKLEDGHSIYLIMGMKMNSSSSASSTLAEVKAEANFNFNLGYQYWFTEEWAVNANIGFFSGEADVNTTNVSSTMITPVLFGFSFYPEALALGRAGRVHFGLNMGAYIGSGAKSNLSFTNFGSSAVSETVFGVEPNAGVDFFVAEWLRLGPSISYHAVGQFNEVIGNRKNYSGPVFSFKMGVLM